MKRTIVATLAFVLLAASAVAQVEITPSRYHLTRPVVIGAGEPGLGGLANFTVRDMDGIAIVYLETDNVGSGIASLQMVSQAGISNRTEYFNNGAVASNASHASIPLSGGILAASGNSGGLVLVTAQGSAPIRFVTGGTAFGNERLRLTNGAATFTVPTSDVRTVSTIATAGAVTYTAAQVVGGMILRDPNGAARSDTTPTAADLVAQFPGAVVNQAIEFTIRNTADAAETITILAGTGVTLSGTMTIAQNNSKRFVFVFTNLGSGTEAGTLYSLGTVVH